MRLAYFVTKMTLILFRVVYKYNFSRPEPISDDISSSYSIISPLLRAITASELTLNRQPPFLRDIFKTFYPIWIELRKKTNILADIFLKSPEFLNNYGSWYLIFTSLYCTVVFVLLLKVCNSVTLPERKVVVQLWTPSSHMKAKNTLKIVQNAGVGNKA